MKSFIEVTDSQDEKVLINVNCIFRVETLKKEKITKTKIQLTPMGYNNYPYQTVETVESYEEIKLLIADAI